MTREQLTRRIDSIIKDTYRIENTVRAMGVTDKERYPKEYGALSADAVRRAEWLACRLRHLLYETAVMEKPAYLLRAADAQGIRFRDREGIFEITLPGIALDSGRKRPSEFLFDPLFFAMEEYFKGRPIRRFRRCVVSCVMIFDRTLPERLCLDVNNPELKRHLDVAAAYLLTDDSPKYLDVYHSAELGGHDAVKMSFMERDRFPRWLGEREQNRGKLPV